MIRAVDALSRDARADVITQRRAKTLIGADVDDEVDCRVKNNECVGDGAEIVLEAAAVALAVRQDVPQQLCDQGRYLTHSEYQQYDDECEGNVAVLSLG